VRLVAKTILGLIPLLRLLNANLVLELSMQILPHVPLVILVTKIKILTTRLKLAKTASEPSVMTQRRANHALMMEFFRLSLLVHQFMNRHNSGIPKVSNVSSAQVSLVKTGQRALRVVMVSRHNNFSCQASASPVKY